MAREIDLDLAGHRVGRAAGQLLRDGQPYFIKGAGGMQGYQQFAMAEAMSTVALTASARGTDSGAPLALRAKAFAQG